MRKPICRAKNTAPVCSGVHRIRDIAILFFLLALPAAVQAQFTFTTNHGTLTISNYTGSSGIVVIPSATNGLPITAIGSYAFAQRNTVTNITIPGSITNIGPGAFYECGSLTNVSIGNGLLSLADSALGNEGCFGVCFGLRSVTLPASVTNVGSYAFWDCPNLTNLAFSGPTVRFGNYACDGAPLKNVTMPSSVSNLVIADGAFVNCTTLTNFLIGTGVRALEIGAGAFTNCPSLPGLTLDPANPFLAFSNGVLFDVNQTMLIWCSPTASGTYVVPDTAVSIQNNAFFGCTNLTGIIFPSGLKTIGHAAFEECSSLSSVDVPDGVANIGSNTFASCASLTNAILGNGATNIGDFAFIDCSNLVWLTLSSNLLVIGNSAFAECYALANVVIPDSVTSIGTFAFDSCSNADFFIGNGIINIGQFAFDRCTKMTNLILPRGLISIGDYGFWYCSGLTNVIIPLSTTNIGVLVFAHCISLMNIEVNTSNPAYASLDGVLFDHSLTTLICCPGGKTGSYAIPDTVTNLEGEAFGNCWNLTTVVVDAGVTHIHNDIFEISGTGTIFFQANAPNIDGSYTLFDAPLGAICYLPGTTGWSNTFGGIPALLWNPKAQTTDGSFGVSTNGFGFNITGTANIPLVVEAAPGLGGPWVSLQSISLTNGPFYFSDPQWTNYLTRFYRFRSP